MDIKVTQKKDGKEIVRQLDSEKAYLMVNGEVIDLKNYIIAADLEINEYNSDESLVMSKGNIGEVLILKSLLGIMLTEKHKKTLFGSND